MFALVFAALSLSKCLEKVRSFGEAVSGERTRKGEGRICRFKNPDAVEIYTEYRL